MMWLLWGPTQPRPAISFSMKSDLYIALYGISRDANGEAVGQRGSPSACANLENLADGIQLADENLGARPSGSSHTRTFSGSRQSGPNVTLMECSIHIWHCL